MRGIDSGLDRFQIGDTVRYDPGMGNGHPRTAVVVGFSEKRVRVRLETVTGWTVHRTVAPASLRRYLGTLP